MRYFSKTSKPIPTNDRKVVKRVPAISTVHITPHPQGWEEWIEPPTVNGIDSLAKEVYEEPLPEVYDTGLLDASGSPILRSVERNGIGFRATVWPVDDE